MLEIGAPMPPAALTPKSLAQAASTILVAAIDPNIDGKSSCARWNFLGFFVVSSASSADGFHVLLVHSGALLSDCAVYTDPLQPHAVGEQNEKQAWDLSEKLIGEKFYEL